MKSLVSEAQKYYMEERNRRMSSNFDIEEYGLPKIIVVGCGGSGNNTITRLKQLGVEGVTTIAINTDKQHLLNTQADKRVLIGRTLTKGLGAGGYPEIGRKAAELARGTLEELLSGADLVFVCAGMGGGTGTGSAPVVAEIAKKQGAIVIGMVQTPFRVERARIKKAEEGLEELRKQADTVVVLDNNKLLEYVPNLPIEQAFSVMDQLISETIKGISDTITQPSLMNIDFADVRAVMGQGGVAVMLVGESRSQNKAKDVVKDCLNHPLLEVDYRGAKGALIHLSGGTDLTIKEAEEIVNNLTFEIDDAANVIWGARISKEMEGCVRVMAIMTGVSSPNIISRNLIEEEANFENGNGRSKFRKIEKIQRAKKLEKVVRSRRSYLREIDRL
ncbi:cell division protein FtsZ [Archaeoglobus sulfaticallidus PM70-1]|uniref:Cell division protein FtsZ n=1 Tax=Archaeoglobus sulfaticallidus PM70-1 TaxID=387631 RepID=N0BNG7_9EURY|nr:cell division protein FtsZ [Archaeoglobus sulfaticallidus]AGK61860.1 cell division protein FtsZ [Archaeoglobus sulfaticallidus PM70-1]